MLKSRESAGTGKHNRRLRGTTLAVQVFIFLVLSLSTLLLTGLSTLLASLVFLILLSLLPNVLAGLLTTLLRVSFHIVCHRKLLL